MEEKLFNKFVSNYNVGSWHPSDAKRFYEYVDYCYLNNVDDNDISELILESNLPNDIKDGLIQKSTIIYDYLLIKDKT